jgi:hypothetical protein
MMSQSNGWSLSPTAFIHTERECCLKCPIIMNLTIQGLVHTEVQIYPCVGPFTCHGIDSNKESWYKVASDRLGKPSKVTCTSEEINDGHWICDVWITGPTGTPTFIVIILWKSNRCAWKLKPIYIPNILGHFLKPYCVTICTRHRTLCCWENCTWGHTLVQISTTKDNFGFDENLQWRIEHNHLPQLSLLAWHSIYSTNPTPQHL